MVALHFKYLTTEVSGDQPYSYKSCHIVTIAYADKAKSHTTHAEIHGDSSKACSFFETEDIDGYPARYNLCKHG